MSDIYAYWRAAVAGAPEAELAKLRLPTIAAPGNGEDPQCGLWKVRPQKGMAHTLMQIWLIGQDGQPTHEWASVKEVAGTIGNRRASFDELCERWLFATPATKDEAAHWRQHGRWPADPPPLPPRTHNAPTDPFEALKVEVEERIAQAKTRLKEPIADQLGCDMARNLQAELLALEKRANAMHEAEKRPHLEAGRRVDAKYRFRDALADWVDKLRKAFGAWMAAEEARLQEERDRKYREECAAAEAEAARIKAEREQLKEQDPALAALDPEPELPAMPPPPEPVKVHAGSSGRKAGLRTDWKVEIVDYKLAALQVIEDPEISILVGKLILRRVRAAKGKLDFPGVKIKEVRRAT